MKRNTSEEVGEEEDEKEEQPLKRRRRSCCLSEEEEEEEEDDDDDDSDEEEKDQQQQQQDDDVTVWKNKPPTPFYFSCFKQFSTRTRKSFVLLDEQRTIAHRLFDVINKTDGSKYAVCVSETGAGKTFVAAQILEWLNTIGIGNYEVFVICPSIVFEKVYCKMQKDFQLPFYYSMNYEAFSCTRKFNKSRQTMGGLFSLETAAAEDKKKKTFLPKPEAIEFVNANPFLVIFDEFQMIKNEGTSRSFAVKAFVELFAQNPSTRFLFMSATPFDKECQVTQFLRILGIINNPLSLPRLNKYPGWQEALNYFASVDRDATASCIQKLDRTMPPKINKSVLLKFVFELYHAVITPRFVYGIPRPRDVSLIHKYARHHYSITDPVDLKMLQDGLSIMEESIQKMQTNRYADGSEYMKLMGQFTTGAVMVETAKLASVARHASQILDACETTKVVIGVNYVEKNVDFLQATLQNYNPLVITGIRKDQDHAMSQKALMKLRSESIDKFNQADTEHRLLIVSVRSCGVGVSLHDTDGRFPRYVILMPSHYFIAMEQFLGRFDRIGVKSAVTNICACALDAKAEFGFLQSMANKHLVQHKSVDRHIGSSKWVVRVPSWPPTRQLLNSPECEMVNAPDLHMTILMNKNNKKR